ncbi:MULTISPECIES: hypothetical protein [Cryobacterium]|uniref:hypothetical protein n=1 Tax=Cryobacterium TaxID=69578 RepID=UPI000CD3AB0B|nr:MULTISPECIES: hypothetical protein [Cryobacterium]POH66030.1 hypothetical protein C3B60_09370 [Cryobacterium zongtaii]TFC46699.1 hypothetical protein E3O57_05510 [Cryobacterium sp. TMN-39-2]
MDTLYPTAPLVARIVGAIVSEFTQREAASDLVTITMGDAGLIVSAAVRVVGSEPATDVCRLVFDSIATVLAAHSPVPIDTIKVTVASIG